MKIIKFEVKEGKPFEIEGKMRSIFFDSKIKVKLSCGGKIVNVWGNNTPDKVTLVLSQYRTGKLILTGRGKGTIELFDKNDPDVFDPKLHQSVFTLND